MLLPAPTIRATRLGLRCFLLGFCCFCIVVSCVGLSLVSATSFAVRLNFRPTDPLLPHLPPLLATTPVAPFWSTRRRFGCGRETGIPRARASCRCNGSREGHLLAHAQRLPRATGVCVCVLYVLSILNDVGS